MKTCISVLVAVLAFGLAGVRELDANEPDLARAVFYVA
jgi:hypothetical protein